jgi:iron complex transport system substrate-binding protein
MNRSIYKLVTLAACILLALAPAMASSFTLKIFGNANMDDTINENDIDYLKKIIQGTAESTNLADADHNGKIDDDDIAQIEKIISGNAETLTLIDQADRTVTVNEPIGRIIALLPTVVRTVVQLEATDKIVGICNHTKGYADNMIEVQAHPELREITDVGMYDDPNKELMLTLEPDVILEYSSIPEVADALQKSTGIPVVCINPSPTGNEYSNSGGPFETWRLTGYIIGKEDRAEELISYCKEKFDEIKEITSDISDDEKPRVYFCHSQGAKDIIKAVTSYDPMDLAGGKNVAAVIEAPFNQSRSVVTEISKEQIIKWDPDIILIHSFSKSPTLSIDKVLSDTVLQTVKAVKDKQIYYTKGWYIGWDPATGVTECFYMGKIFHPKEFEDINVEEESNKILKTFYGADGLYTWTLEHVGNYYNWE